MFLKKLCVSLIAAGCAMVSNAQEGMTKGEQDWVETVNAVADKRENTEISVKVLVYADVTSTSESVLAASYKDAVCTMHLTSRFNSQDSTLQSLAATPDVARLAIVAHEYGHCVHRAAQRAGNSSIKADKWPEAFADAYAIAWVSSHYPAHLTAVKEFLQRLRKMDARGAYAYGVPIVKSAESFVLRPDQEVMEKANAILRRARTD